MYSALIGLLTVLFAGGEQAQAAQSVRSMTIERGLIVRVPVRPHLNGRLRWAEEDHGPKCLPVSAIAGASLAGSDGIDFVLRSRQRVRAKFDDDCRGLDFYDGFYVQPQDRRICARRDAISSRVGGTCEINRFRMLTPRLDNDE